MDFECIDDRFSTTRRVTKTPLEPDPCLQLPSTPTPKIAGGLRTRGFYKAEGPEPIVSVITIVYNCASSIEETMLSVLNQTYSNVEYLVIDGGSTDGTVEVIRKYDHAIDYWISEPDRGIYDAINKGVRASTGQWLNFMNAKDVLLNSNTIQTLANRYLNGASRFIYSDVLLRNGPFGQGEVGIHACDHQIPIIHHQGSVYQKSLHKEYGLYIVAKGMTISDYLFFSIIDKQNFRKADEPIALFDMTGVSTGKNSTKQMYVVDHLVNGIPLNQTVVRFLLLNCPKPVEKFLVGTVRFFRRALARK